MWARRRTSQRRVSCQQKRRNARHKKQGDGARVRESAMQEEKASHLQTPSNHVKITESIME
eukprot:8688040-Karenia_brevis.AAC.1